MARSGEATIAVVLGASEFPLYPAFAGSDGGPAFAASARAFADCLEAQFGPGWSAGHLLDLFDSDESARDQRRRLRRFLDARRDTATRLIVYYVGHGAFYGGQQYFLALRGTEERDEEYTGLGIGALAATVKDAFAHGQTFLILDCCYAGEAVRYFEGDEQGLARQADHATLDVFPAAGTALLCASSKHRAAISKGKTDRTQFSECLIDVLRKGVESGGEYLSLRDVGDETARRVKALFGQEAVHPEVRCPRQSEGVDPAEVPLFRNPAWSPTLERLLPDLAKRLVEDDHIGRLGVVAALERHLEGEDEVLRDAARIALEARLDEHDGERDFAVREAIRNALGTASLEAQDSLRDDVARLRRELARTPAAGGLEHLERQVAALLAGHPDDPELQDLEREIAAERRRTEAVPPPPAPDRTSVARRGWGLRIVLPAAGVAAGVLAAVLVLLWRGPVLVPDLAGLDRQAARQALEAASLQLGRVEGEHDPDRAEGAVLRHLPPRGAQVERGAAVDLVVSLGAPPVPVPGLTGLTLDSARARLAGLDVTLGEIRRQPSARPAGEVLEQSPAPGAPVAPGSPVALTVSDGPPVSAIPDVGGLAIGEAVRVLERAGMSTGDLEHEPAAGPPDTVLRQHPTPGERVPPGTAVHLVVSTGPEAFDALLAAQPPGAGPASGDTGAGDRERVRELLVLAEEDMAALRLTMPPGRNALERYRAVLDSEPGNADARAGLERIVSRYLALAEDATSNGDLQRGETLLERARQVDPADPRVGAALAHLGERRRASGEAARRQAAEAAARRAEDEAAAQRAREDAERRERARQATEPRAAAAPLRARLAVFPHDSIRACFYPVGSQLDAAARTVVSRRSDLELVYSFYARGAQNMPFGAGDGLWEGSAARKTPRVGAVQEAARALGADAVLMAWYHCSHKQAYTEDTYAIHVYLVDVRTGTMHRVERGLLDADDAVEAVLRELEVARRG